MNNTWLIGAGNMSQAYIKVLDEIKNDYIVIGRGEESAQKCREFTTKSVISGGLDTFLKSNPSLPTHAIVSVSSDELTHTTMALLNYGIKNILVEKPAGFTVESIKSLNNLAKEKSANVLLAYNRRFYASVYKAKEMIEADGGILSGNFEFTEWSHVIENLDKTEAAFHSWLVGNSTHVIDLAFYLMGKPKEICSFTTGSLTWHPASSIFAGAGVTEEGALFNYHANWESAGRWSVEVLTKNHKFIFRPMEKLSVIKKGTVKEEEITDIDYTLDDKFKPGIYKEVETFINGDYSIHCSISEQAKMIDIYYKIANYK
ncbi:MAG TPA: Gfo/Idh/MocA family oxidoreductase [Sulfurospirillum arcachonense]|nr:Gfo/Idh/MocA family oxidoreductase [Sulfurospirillum arcachonense]